VYSAADGGVIQASSEFTDELHEIDPAVDSEEALFKTIRPSLLSCSWCSRPGVLRKLLVCSACRKVDYCSPECQRADWKHFHKGDECHRLRQDGATKGTFMTRYDQFRRTDIPVATLPVPLGGRFQGDLFAFYVIGLDERNCISDTTLVPPAPGTSSSARTASSNNKSG